MIVYNVKHLQYASKIFLLIIYNYLKNNEIQNNYFNLVLHKLHYVL